jgi:hypothetical protein
MVAAGALALAPGVAGARGLGVEVWTDRGDDAVYQPGQSMEIRTRVSDDAYLMVYEIDAEGYVRLLYPFRGSSGFVEGRRTYPVPPERSNVELVVQGTVGQCYVVAIAAREPFREMPWYLRPYDMQAEEVGYEGVRDDEEGITAEGRIVGDPFVAMERIRRRVLEDPEDADGFGTSYATYYVHNEVRYPRYLCYDCHRPGHWAWWPGFDPYYTTCSVFSFRVNWGWGWGPGYWFGTVPYYYYVVRYDCPPRYRTYYRDRRSFSSWDGWRRWNSMWGSRLVRYKSDPPPGYVPPSKFPQRDMGRAWKPAPPGFIVGDVRKGREGLRPTTPLGRNRPAERGEREPRPIDERDDLRGRSPAERMPMREARPESERDRGTGRDGEVRGRADGEVPWIKEAPRAERPREERPRLIDRPYIERRPEAPRTERPREERPRLIDRPYIERRSEAPRMERAREDRPREPSREMRAPEKPRESSPPRDSRGGDRGKPSDAPQAGQRTRG